MNKWQYNSKQGNRLPCSESDTFLSTSLKLLKQFKDLKVGR